MGKLLLAAEYVGEAEACFRNAQALAPRDAGGGDLATRMAANLALYQAGKPARTPWREGELP